MATAESILMSMCISDPCTKCDVTRLSQALAVLEVLLWLVFFSHPHWSHRESCLRLHFPWQIFSVVAMLCNWSLRGVTFLQGAQKCTLVSVHDNMSGRQWFPKTCWQTEVKKFCWMQTFATCQEDFDKGNLSCVLTGVGTSKDWLKWACCLLQSSIRGHCCSLQIVAMQNTRSAAHKQCDSCKDLPRNKVASNVTALKNFHAMKLKMLFSLTESRLITTQLWQPKHTHCITPQATKQKSENGQGCAKNSTLNETHQTWQTASVCFFTDFKCTEFLHVESVARHQSIKIEGIHASRNFGWVEFAVCHLLLALQLDATGFFLPLNYTGFRKKLSAVHCKESNWCFLRETQKPEHLEQAAQRWMQAARPLSLTADVCSTHCKTTQHHHIETWKTSLLQLSKWVVSLHLRCPWHCFDVPILIVLLC